MEDNYDLVTDPHTTWKHVSGNVRRCLEDSKPLWWAYPDLPRGKSDEIVLHPRLGRLYYGAFYGTLCNVPNNGAENEWEKYA